MKIRSILVITLLSLHAALAAAEDRVITLRDAYEAALKTNELVKISEESALQAESKIDQAWTYLYPRLTANGAYTKYDKILPPNGGFVFQPRDQDNASLVLTQPLYTGGRTMAGLRAARTMREASKHDLSVTQQGILLGVSEAYYAVLKAQKLLEVSRGSLERMERHKKVTEREAATRKSKANISSLLRASTLVSQARITLVRAEDGLKIARQRLGLLTQLPEDIVIAEPSPLDVPQASMEAMQETAIRSRDDYASAKMSQELAKEFVTITAGAHHPQVYAEGGMTYQNSNPRTDLDATTYYGGIRLTIPLFEGGLMKAEVAEARSKQRQAELSTALLKRTIESDVQEARINLQTINAVLDTAKQQFEYAKSNFDTVEDLFSEGLLPSLSLIDAEQALSYAEKELVSATWDRQLAILRLKKTIGLLGKES